MARLSEHLAGWTTVTTGLGGNVVAHLASNGTEVFALASYVTYRLNRAMSRWDTDTPPSPVHDLRDGYGRVFAATEAGAYALVGTSWGSVGGGPWKPCSGTPSS